MFSLKSLSETLPLSKRSLGVILPFLATVALLVILGSISVDMLSAARAFVGGESLWANGEKEAAYFLNRYAQTRAEADYRRFEENIAVPLGDRKARLELSKSDPDLGIARQGFIEGRNHPDDIAGMMRLFRRFGKVSFMAKAIGIWTVGDDHIAVLTGVAAELHRRIASGESDARVLRPLMEQANAINRLLIPLEEEFAATLGEASRKTQFLLLAAMLFLASTLVVLTIVLWARMSRRTEQVEDALRRSEERLTLAVSGSMDGLWDLNLVSGETYYSPRFNALLDYGPNELKPSVDAFLEILHPDDMEVYRTVTRAHLRHHAPYELEFRLHARNGDYRWFLTRGQSVRDERGRAVRMAGSIKDITDAKLAEAAIGRHAMQQGLIAAFGQMALKNPEADELMTRAVLVVSQGLDASFCRLLATGPDDRTLLLKGASGWDAEWLRRVEFDAAEETEDRFTIGTREAVIIDDFQRESRFKPSAMLRAHGVRSGAEMLICGAHGTYGVLGIYSRELAQFTQKSVDFLRGITNTVASAMDRKIAEERLTQMAQFDPLTSLPNRTL